MKGGLKAPIPDSEERGGIALGAQCDDIGEAVPIHIAGCKGSCSTTL
jgi:hypothetical protein